MYILNMRERYNGAGMEETFRKEDKSLKRIFMFHLRVGIFLLLYFGIIDRFDLGCPIRMITGIPCPACGMTRAWLSVIQLNFHEAISYHPLFWMGPPLLFFAIHKNSRLFRRIPIRVQNIILATGGTALFITYLIRMFVFPQSG